MTPPEPGEVLVLSPHLDDAVLSCGLFLRQCQNAVVSTIFAGIPEDSDAPTEWDASAGFASAREAMTIRREEDRQALSLLHGRPVWLDFLDSQYGFSPTIPALASAIASLIDRYSPDTVLFPAGLFHSDHALVHCAAVSILPRHASLRWLLYEEAHYRRLPGLLQQRLANMLQHGLQATPWSTAMPDASAQAAKLAAIGCYASQLRALQAKIKDGYADALVAERFWHVQPDKLAREA